MPMLYGRHSQQRRTTLVPNAQTNPEMVTLPKYQLPTESLPAWDTYHLIADDLLDEGNARQNLATFCQTQMQPQAQRLMAETLAKNEIDKSEYPRTAEIENRCVNILADLWHAGPQDDYLGTSTVGSSEACMLAGLAMKKRWAQRLTAAGINPATRTPNLIIASSYQVCWEKFARYWDVDLRQIPMTHDHLTLNVDQAIAAIDDNTIGIVAILGITYSGQYDDVAGLDRALSTYNQAHGTQLNIHVDAASGGLYAPFVQPDLKWDFQLPTVVSINTSGHKYGLVYPGIGWVVWRNHAAIPEDLIFNVSYLGGEMPTMGINFSHSAAPLIGQYYNFIQLGAAGYTRIHQQTRAVAQHIAQEIMATGLFTMLSDGSDLPVLCYQLNQSLAWDLYDLTDKLRETGWQVPTYHLPDNLSDQVVQRIVCRQDLGMNIAEEFCEDFDRAIRQLQAGERFKAKRATRSSYGFTH